MTKPSSPIVYPFSPYRCIVSSRTCLMISSLDGCSCRCCCSCAVSFILKQPVLVFVFVPAVVAVVVVERIAPYHVPRTTDRLTTYSNITLTTPLVLRILFTFVNGFSYYQCSATVATLPGEWPVETMVFTAVFSDCCRFCRCCWDCISVKCVKRIE